MAAVSVYTSRVFVWGDGCGGILPRSRKLVGKDKMNEANNWLMATYKEDGFRRLPLCCKDGFFISIQASAGHYCTPRRTYDGPYSQIEAGYPSWVEELLLPYMRDKVTFRAMLKSVFSKFVTWRMKRYMVWAWLQGPKAAIYPWLPVEVMDAVIAKHAGIK